MKGINTLITLHFLKENVVNYLIENNPFKDIDDLMEHIATVTSKNLINPDNAEQSSAKSTRSVKFK